MQCLGGARGGRGAAPVARARAVRATIGPPRRRRAARSSSRAHSAAPSKSGKASTAGPHGALPLSTASRPSRRPGAPANTSHVVAPEREQGEHRAEQPWDVAQTPRPSARPWRAAPRPAGRRGTPRAGRRRRAARRRAPARRRRRAGGRARLGLAAGAIATSRASWSRRERNSSQPAKNTSASSGAQRSPASRSSHSPASRGQPFDVAERQVRAGPGRRRAWGHLVVEAVVDRRVEDQRGGSASPATQRGDPSPSARSRSPAPTRRPRPAPRTSSPATAARRAAARRRTHSAAAARSRTASAHSAAPASSTAAGTPGVIVVEAASAGGESPTSAVPAVAHGSGTIRRASAAGEAAKPTRAARASATGRCGCRHRVGGRDRQGVADAVRLHQPPTDDLPVGLELTRVPARVRALRYSSRPTSRSETIDSAASRWCGSLPA